MRLQGMSLAFPPSHSSLLALTGEADSGGCPHSSGPTPPAGSPQQGGGKLQVWDRGLLTWSGGSQDSRPPALLATFLVLQLPPVATLSIVSLLSVPLPFHFMENSLIPSIFQHNHANLGWLG